MGRRTVNAKKFIVSCRVDSDEMDQLQSLAKEIDCSISELLRKSLINIQGSEEQSRLSA